jgi:chorismate synthase
MATNSFGNIFRITTFGESHGKAIGVVIDGCPAGLELSDDEINAALALRAPGNSPFTSKRKEPDVGEILSGVFEGKTTGSPICFLIRNQDHNSAHYEPIKDLVRPGHANSTYIQKYGVFDYRGGGRASARETACRVAAGAVAKKVLAHYCVSITACLKQPTEDQLTHVMAEGDSLGGIIEFVAEGLPCGLGDPVYEKLEANLACAMLSLPATKGFEIDAGFSCVSMKGSEHNKLPSGTLGGISTGKPLIGRVACKPTSSIKIPQATTTLEGKPATFVLPEGSRHDPCVAIRAVPVVEAMAALVLVDALLLNRCVRL